MHVENRTVPVCGSVVGHDPTRGERGDHHGEHNAGLREVNNRRQHPCRKRGDRGDGRNKERSVGPSVASMCGHVPFLSLGAPTVKGVRLYFGSPS